MVRVAAEPTVSGGHGGGETPVPIPNTAVKPASADGTWGATPWESRTPPGFRINEAPARAGASLHLQALHVGSCAHRCGSMHPFGRCTHLRGHLSRLRWSWQL